MDLDLEIARCDGCGCAVVASTLVRGYEQTLCPDCRWKLCAPLRALLKKCAAGCGTLAMSTSEFCLYCWEDHNEAAN